MVDWLLKGSPRKVQEEALRRSYYGEVKWQKNPDLFDLNNEIITRTVRNDPARGWGHFLEMRLGKTPLLLNEFELYRRDKGYEWVVVLTPNKYKMDWPIEAERFGLTVPSFAFDSHDRDKAIRFINKNRHGGLLAVNYEALGYQDTLVILQDLVGPKTLIAGDESITIKKHNSGMATAAIQLATECGARRALSGKPVSQGPHDMWAQLRLIGEIDGFVYHAFRTMFCKMGGFQGKKVVGFKNESRYFEIMDRCSFSARRVDWLVTPGSDYSERYIRLTDIQLRYYKQMQDSFLTELEDGTLVVADQIITKLIKMQQIASGFIIDEDGKTHDLVPLASNPRVNEIKYMLENELTGKLVIYCHFTKSIINLQEALKAYRPAVIRGSMKNEDVIEEKRRFNTESECRVLIGQIQATKYGHMLMGSVEDPCYTEIFFENNYSLNDRSQCEERTQGEGQQYPISIIDFIATEHDRAPIRALQRKEDVASSCLRYDRSTGILPPVPTLSEGLTRGVVTGAAR